jgi:hypothetical protein
MFNKKWSNSIEGSAENSNSVTGNVEADKPSMLSGQLD